MQQQQQYIDRRQVKYMNNSNKTISNDFYKKLERLRSSKKYPQRTATELLNESKAFFVKSQEVLHNKQTFSINQRIIPSFRTPQPCRFPYQENFQSNFSIESSTTNNSDGIFESVSVLSLSDQTTLDSTNSLTNKKQTILPSSITIIERNARIIKWLFQLHKANEPSSF